MNRQKGGSPISLGQLSMNLLAPVDGLTPSEHTFLHYCSLDAFYSIMDTGRLRFTSAKSTNDPSEFIFGQEVVDRVLENGHLTLKAHEKDWVRGAFKLKDSRDFRAFVFCMSEAIDDEAEVGELSQWRLYGSDGRGVALIFDTSSANKRDLLHRLTSIPRKVVYGEDAGKTLVEKTIAEFIDRSGCIGEQAAAILDEKPSLRCEFLLNWVFWLPSVIKHKAYRHEREVRLVRGDVGGVAGNPLVFFEKGSIRRPAIELQISNVLGEEPSIRHESPIKGVIIGPSGDQSAIADSIRYFLEARGWDLEVRRSDIPYRAV